MNKAVILITLGLFLSACSRQQIPQPKDKIDITPELKSCTVFYDHIECTLLSGDTFFAYRNRINEITTWDKSAWKKEEKEIGFSTNNTFINPHAIFSKIVS